MDFKDFLDRQDLVSGKVHRVTQNYLIELMIATYNQALEDAAWTYPALEYTGEAFVNRQSILSLKKNEE